MPRVDAGMVTLRSGSAGVSDWGEFRDRSRNCGALAQPHRQTWGCAANDLGRQHHSTYGSVRENARGGLRASFATRCRACANAVIGMRYDATEVMQGVTEVLAYGTVVHVERIS